MDAECRRIDPHFQLPNARQFRIDRETLGLNKLCMTEVVNADLAIATSGEDVFYKGCKEVLDMVAYSLKEHGLDQLIHLYVFNYKNFLLAANDALSAEQFSHIIKKFYDEYEYSISQGSNITGVSRFVVVLQPDDMIARAFHTMLEHRDTQENFIVAEDEIVDRTPYGDDAKVLDLINRAINSDGVVPYYQGIRNNITKRIDKYEALMRIIDEDGQVYSPFHFLDIAKKYKFYNKISQMLLNKAMDDFRDRPESLSINISLFDVQTASFRLWFLEKLKKFPDAKRITIEFVETENYQEDETLYEFIHEARAFGCKISVDDFGAGYATYAAIISLRPDFIKVDGSIVRYIAEKDENLIILQSICYMAELINASIVAEFVKDEAIQALLEENHVPFSQGFLFAKPEPLEVLPVVETV